MEQLATPTVIGIGLSVIAWIVNRAANRLDKISDEIKEVIERVVRLEVKTEKGL